MVDVTFASKLRTEDWIVLENDEFQLPDHINRLLGDVNWLVESDDYDDSVREVLDGLHGWVRSGIAAHTVKLKKLYTHTEFKLKSFAEFCKKVAKRAPWSVNQQIEGAFVVVELAKNGFSVLPQNAAQARLLSKYVTTGELIKKWQMVIDQVEPHQLTAKKIAEILEPFAFKPKALNLGLSPETEQAVMLDAAALGISPDEYIQQLRALKAKLATQNPETSPVTPDPVEEITDSSAVDEVEENAEKSVKPKLPFRYPCITSGFYTRPTCKLTAADSSGSQFVYTYAGTS